MISHRLERTEAKKAALVRLHAEMRRRAEVVVADALSTCPASQRSALLRSIIFAGTGHLATATCAVSTASLLCSAAYRISPAIRPLSPRERADALFSIPAEEAA